MYFLLTNRLIVAAQDITEFNIMYVETIQLHSWCFRCDRKIMERFSTLMYLKSEN